MSSDKKQTAFRLSLVGRRLLKKLAAWQGISLNAAIEIAIREAARKRGIK